MKVLAYTSPARGHLFPMMPILLELQGRGHDVVVRTLAEAVPQVRALGFEADAVDPAIPAIQLEDFGARSAQAALKAGVRTFTRRAGLEVPEVKRLITDERPDLLLVDTNAWGAAAVAEASGIPWALVQVFPTPLPSADVPPFGPGLRPLDGPLGRLRNRLLRPLVLGTVEKVVMAPLNEVRRAAGASPMRDAHDLYSRPPLTLYLTSTAFEYPRTDWPDSFCFVGPLNWDPPTPEPAWLGEIERPVALVTTSSEFQDDGELVRTALAGLALEELSVVATMPAGVEPFEVPANARVEQFVPHSQLLPRATVAITHGGMGATQKVLAAGVPVVVVPWGRDQAEVGRRAEAAGAGVLLPRKKLAPDRLREAVRQAIALKPAAEELAREMAAAGGAPLAVDRLEELVRTLRPPIP